MTKTGYKFNVIILTRITQKILCTYIHKILLLFDSKRSNVIAELKSKDMANMCQIASTFPIFFEGLHLGLPYVMLTNISYAIRIANFYIRPRWQPLGRIVSRLPRPKLGLLVSPVFFIIGLCFL